MADGKDSFMVEANSPNLKTPQQHKPLSMTHNILRILPIMLTAASIAVMVTNSQTVIIFAMKFEAHYYYSPSFKFFVAANAIVCGCSILTMIVDCLLLRREGSQRCRFFLFSHDIVMTVLLISGCAAATAIGYVGQYGEEHVGWEAICDRVNKFCKTNLVSILLSYLAFFAYLGLTLFTAYKCVSSSSSPKNK